MHVVWTHYRLLWLYYGGSVRQVKGKAVFPGAGMFEAARAAGVSLLGDEKLAQSLVLTAVTIPAPLLLNPGEVSVFNELLSHILGTEVGAQVFYGASPSRPTRIFWCNSLAMKLDTRNLHGAGVPAVFP